ncbi:MAG: Tfp pilus assembly PilM family ATPase [Candidatus Omnitrophota bacterium]|jgi:Tfp pilus assembly PilM family ATPase
MKLKRIHCLEISTTHIKLLTAVKLKDGLQIDRATIKPYESKAVLKDILKESIEIHGVDDGAVATTVWSPTLISRKISIAQMTDDELKIAIPIEADKYIPFSVDECMIDYIKIGENLDTKKINLLLIASKRDLIEDRCQILASVGVKVRFIDVSPLALINLYQYKHNSFEDDKPQMLIRIGDKPGQFVGEDNFVCVHKSGVPMVLKDLGDKTTTQGNTSETWTHVNTQIQNAARFYESQAHEKVQSVIVASDPVIFESLKESMGAHGFGAVSHWNVIEGMEIADSATETVINEAPGIWTIPISLAVRGLSS